MTSLVLGLLSNEDQPDEVPPYGVTLDVNADLFDDDLDTVPTALDRIPTE